MATCIGAQAAACSFELAENRRVGKLSRRASVRFPYPD